MGQTEKANEKLTEKVVGRLLPKGKVDHIIFDTAIPGFGLRMREGGTRTWIFQYKLAGTSYRMKLGRAASMKAEEARKLALRHHNSVQQGGNPAAEKEASKVQAAKTFGDLVQRYLEFKKPELRPRSYVEVERHLDTYAEPLHRLPVASIDRNMVKDLLNRVADKSTKGNGAVTANRMRSSLSAMFTWGMKEELATKNPVISVDKRDEASRDRVLADAELKAIWEALGSDNYSTIVKLLLLTGQRANEISGLQWSEIDLDRGVILFPAERVKNNRVHQIPMSDTVRGILEEHPRVEGCDLLFTAGNGAAFSTWSKPKEGLDAKLIGKVTGHWTTHDLRRTCATRMADMEVQPHIVEAILNHVSGHRAGVAGIYNRAMYAKEKAEALTLWADHIAAVLAGRKSKVVQLRPVAS
jgi:integrase